MALEITSGPYNFTVGQGYIDVLLTATGGYEPYSWEIINGTVLPDGMFLNGATGHIGGDAFTVQTVTVDFMVTDSNPGGVETATASIVFTVADSPTVDPFESFVEAHLGVVTTKTLPISGGTAPYSLTMLEWSFGPYPAIDASSIVGSDVVLSYTLDTDAGTKIYYRITDANGMYYDILVNVLGIDAAVGQGGNGIPHLYYRDGSNAYVEAESPKDVNITGIGGVYGGVPPYTITNIGDLPPGSDITYWINPNFPYNGTISGTFSGQGVYPLSFRIEDSATSLSVTSIPALWVWNDGGNTTVESSIDITTDQPFVEITDIPGGSLSLISTDYNTVYGNYGFLSTYAGPSFVSVDLITHSYVGVCDLPANHFLYIPLSFTSDGSYAFCVTSNGSDRWLEVFTHSNGVLTFDSSLSLPSAATVYGVEAIGVALDGTIYVSGSPNNVYVIPAPYTSIQRTITLPNGNGVYSVWLAENYATLLVGGYSSLTGEAAVFVVHLSDDSVEEISVPNLDPSIALSADGLTLLCSLSYSPTMVRIASPFTSSSTVEATDMPPSAFYRICPISDNSGFIISSYGPSIKVFKSPYTVGDPNVVTDLIGPNTPGQVMVGKWSTATPITENNILDTTIDLYIYKPVVIDHILLTEGHINEPYRYRIMDNYVDGDLFYPTTYFIDTGGQGLLPTGYTIEHDVNTHENFIVGTTEFSNAFPITLASSNDLYNGGAPRSTWNTVLYVTGVVTVTHEVV